MERLSAPAPAPSPATLAERFAAQLLVGAPARDPLEVTRRLLAVQGQDPRGARLAIRARSVGLTAADVDRELTERRSLLITWLNRGTLHLVASEDYPWLHALTAPPLFTASARRLAQEGVPPQDAERGVAAIERALIAEGPLTRAQLAERIAAVGVRTEGQALIHLLLLASLRGIAVRGPMVAREHAYVHVRDWLGESRPVQRERALAELARRYLAGHGPASERDLAKWAGLPLRDARAGLTAIATELEEREDGTVALLGARATHGRSRRALPPPRLLGPYDPLLLGWSSRAALLGTHQGIVTVNGLFRPFALVQGRAVAIWRLSSGEVQIEPLSSIAPADAAALQDEAADVLRFMDFAAR
ncbi:MAG TPA: winged helix DNA-binding domain-containing protein [Solirubrobacteraceae bacterium]